MSVPNPNRRKYVYLSPGGAFRGDVMQMWIQAGFVGTLNPDDADIICWLGGADIDPQLYGEVALDCTSMHPKMDVADMETYVNATSQFKVGICRGAQFLNAVNKGKMWQDVDGHHQSHEIYDWQLKRFIKVSSIHHQQMIPSDEATIIALANIATHKRRQDSEWNYDGKNALALHVSLGGKFIEKIARTHLATDYEVLWYSKDRALCYQPHPEIDGTIGRQYFFDLVNKYYGKD